MGAISDEHGKRFHQDISQIERRYNVKYWLTAAGVLKGSHHLVNIRGKRRQSECI